MYENYLNTENAPKIADGIMKVIPSDIIITDANGVILASRDKERLGKLHQDALTALKRKESYVVCERSADRHKGVNLPIIYNNCVLGVIVIYGEVAEVMPIGQICLTIATLTIENWLLSDMSSIRGNRLKDFLYEWIGLTEDCYNDAFYDQAAYLGIDLKLPRTAIIITSRRIRSDVVEMIKDWLKTGEYIVRQGMGELLLLLRSDKYLMVRLERLIERGKDLEYCFVGESNTVAKRTTDSVLQTFQIAKALNIRKRILFYHDVELECQLYNVEMTKEVENLICLLRREDEDGILRETISAYVEDNNNYSEICRKLHIHRNTLNYRLAKIEGLFNKNPRCAKELMMLYIATIKMGNDG